MTQGSVHGPAGSAAATETSGTPGPGAFAAAAGHGQHEPLVALVAFGLAVEGKEAATPETVARLRQKAEAMLADHAIRHLHNRAEDIRQDAIRHHLGTLRPPPGMVRLILANLLALALAALAWLWLSSHPAVLRPITSLITGNAP